VRVLLATVCLTAPGTAAAQGAFVAELAVQGKLRIGLVPAVQIEKQLGQLLVVNVDGFGASGDLAVSDDYIDLVERLQVGGVIPHYGQCSPALIRRTNEALLARTKTRLLIASDIVSLCAPGGARATFGDGYVGGFVGRHRDLADDSFRSLAVLNAYVMRWLGIDWSLGPTVDTSTGDARVAQRATAVAAALHRFGILVTIKHWPFLPPGVDLHRESVDLALPLAQVEAQASIFRRLAPAADAIMTTHVYDSEVDDALVTLSQPWVEHLLRSTGFRGPIVTDGLFMLRSHRERARLPRPLPGLGSTGNDEIAGWAAGALLVGHDMVILEGTAATSTAVFRRLLELACRADELGASLRGRIEAAHGKVLRMKAVRVSGSGAADGPVALVERVIRYVEQRGAAGPGDDPEGREILVEIAADTGVPAIRGR
jgi:hypothetical protein